MKKLVTLEGFLQSRLHSPYSPIQEKDRDVIGSARATAIHDCSIEANNFSPITQLPNQFAVYGTYITRHAQPER